jgi:hypothetical protein
VSGFGVTTSLPRTSTRSSRSWLGVGEVVGVSVSVDVGVGVGVAM